MLPFALVAQGGVGLPPAGLTDGQPSLPPYDCALNAVCVKPTLRVLPLHPLSGQATVMDNGVQTMGKSFKWGGKNKAASCCCSFLSLRPFCPVSPFCGGTLDGLTHSHEGLWLTCLPAVCAFPNAAAA